MRMYLYQKSIFLLLFFIIFLTLLFEPSICYALEIESKKELTVSFLDVSQGDSIVIVFPNKKVMLVDSGMKEEGGVIVKYLLKQKIKQIDYYVNTHPDIDHLGGFVDVARKIKIKRVIDSGRVYHSATFHQYFNYVKKRSIPIKIAEEGTYLSIDESVQVFVLNSGYRKKSNNSSSIALKITYGDVDYLLAGDIPHRVEQSLLSKYILDSDVLKVSHHGSRTSSSLDFLKAVNPKVAILSYDKENPFGHPHKNIVNRLRNLRIKVYSTEESGHIMTKTDGTHLYINSKTVPIEAN